MALVISFANPKDPIVTDIASVHDNESFRVRWSAVNTGDEDAPKFADFFVITSIPEGCPGSDDNQHEVVFKSDFAETELAAGVAGNPVEAKVGPFRAGFYRISVQLAADLDLDRTTTTAFKCIEIKKAM